MSLEKDQITVIIPVLNEEKALGIVLDEIKNEGYDNILVVDGYSTDNTVKVAMERDVKVIQQHGIGKTGAIKTAIEYIDTPYMIIMDGDCTYSAADIKKFYIHANNYNYIIGVRNSRNIGLIHKIGNWLISRTFNILFNTGISDVCSGMYFLNTKMAKKLELGSKRFSTEVEVAAQIATNYKMTEVPIDYRSRIGKRKLSTLRDGVQILSTIISLSRKYNPVLFFSTLSALLIFPAVIILLWVLYELIEMSTWHSSWALFGVMLLLLSSQGFTVATIALLLRRMEYRFFRKDQ